VQSKKDSPDLYLYSTSDESSHDVSNAEEQMQFKATSSNIKVHQHTKQKELKSNKTQKTGKRKHTRDNKRFKPEYEQDVKNVYFEDRHRDKGNNNINTFSSRMRPFYDVNRKSIGFVKYKQPKKDTLHRYYVKNIDFVEAEKKKDTVIKRTSEKETLKEDLKTDESLSSWCKNLEEEQKCKTREYNEQLAENPHNIELWLQYINFQVLNKINSFLIYFHNQ
jgi:hypothetical protein